MTTEQRQRQKEEAASRRAWKADLKLQKDFERWQKKAIKQELSILKFMKRTGVEYHHHGRHEMVNIDSSIKYIKEEQRATEYNSYYWNYSPDGSSQMPVALLGCLFSSSEFNSIYDVPLDGTYRFQIYDSGQRGLGSFNRITAVKQEEEAYVPYVNPGAIIPITAN